MVLHHLFVSRITWPFHQTRLSNPHDNELMNTDILSLRAQLKSFERDFKATHNRSPSVDDIKTAGFGAAPPPKQCFGSSLPP